MPRQGLQCFDPLVYQGIDNMDLAGRIAAKINEWHPDAVFVDSGGGGGVIDRLRMLGFDITEVNFGGKASTMTHANKRAEMWFAMRDWLRAGGAIPNLVDLKQDLGAPVYWYDRTSRLILEPKEDIKKRGLPSPDLGDALALTFAHAVHKRNPFAKRSHSLDYDPIGEAHRLQVATSRDYDPLDLVQRA